LHRAAQSCPEVLAVATAALAGREAGARKGSVEGAACESDRSSDSAFSMEADRCELRDHAQSCYTSHTLL